MAYLQALNLDIMVLPLHAVDVQASASPHWVFSRPSTCCVLDSRRSSAVPSLSQAESMISNTPANASVHSELSDVACWAVVCGKSATVSPSMESIHSAADEILPSVELCTPPARAANPISRDRNFSAGGTRSLLRPTLSLVNICSPR